MVSRGWRCLALGLMSIQLSTAWAGSILPPAEALVRTAPDFRLQQSLRLEEAGHSRMDLSTAHPGLSWAPAGAAEQFANRRPNAVLRLNDDTRHLILADLREKRVYLLENQPQGLRVLRHMYATIGKNGTRKQVQDDGRTPVGVYTFTRYLDDAELPELYGSGAFPLNYPNSWDRRAARTGYGIWVHGIPRDHYTRPPLSSEGCVAVGNEDFLSLKPFIHPGETRVIFSDEVRWLDDHELSADLQSIEQAVENWRQTWNSLDTDAYLGFYADDFSTPEMSRAQFASNKYRVNAHKRFIEVNVDKLNIFAYPGEGELRLVEFVQDYRSDTYNGQDLKRQFWRLDNDGAWRIVHELSSPLS